jgi:lipid II:glycine glycyltransferase (peptidoglycan interpeptide bridge formation enzyme)
MDLSSFRRLVQSLGEHVRIMLASRGGAIQGAIVVPFSRHAAYYLYGGRSEEAVPGAMHLLHWDTIRAFRLAGVSTYDFVGARIDPPKGSKQEGLSVFKQRFGSRLNRGYMWRYPLRPIQYRAYSLAARLLRGGDIVQQESARMSG